MLKPTVAKIYIGVGLVFLAVSIWKLFQREYLGFSLDIISSLCILALGWLPLRRAARKGAEGDAMHAADPKRTQQ